MAVTVKLPDNITRVEKEDKILFFNPDIPAWLVTNQNGAFLLSLCDGENTVSDIVDALEGTIGTGYAEKAKQFFNEAIASGVFDKPVTSSIPIKQERQQLNSVQLSVSRSCNLNCMYCYATDRVESAFPKMVLDDYISVIDDITSFSEGTEFTITGGEPLMNKDIFAIAQYIRSKHSAVDLLTNGTLISPSNIDDIKRSFDKVSISLDGSTKEKHEFYRGKGTYERTINAIDLLDKNKIPCGLSMTVNRLNIHDVEDMAAKYGNRLSFQPLFPAGNAKKSENDLSITGREYYEALQKASGVNPMGYCETTLSAARQKRRCKCAIGGSELSISETGDIYPCHLLHYPQFLIGNIHKDKISELYDTSSIISQCAGMVVDNIEGCSSCFLKYVCGGACRARAFHECGNINTCGTFCEYEKLSFVNGIFEIYSNNKIS